MSSCSLLVSCCGGTLLVMFETLLLPNPVEPVYGSTELRKGGDVLVVVLSGDRFVNQAVSTGTGR